MLMLLVPLADMHTARADSALSSVGRHDVNQRVVLSDW